MRKSKYIILLFLFLTSVYATLSISIHLLNRDYSEVQKGKDICDRICGVAKSRMRSWLATGNNLLNAHDIKEEMEHAGGVKNTSGCGGDYCRGR